MVVANRIYNFGGEKMSKRERIFSRCCMGIVFALLLLVACGGGNDASTSSNDNSSSSEVIDGEEQITLVMSIWNDALEFSTLIDAFELQHPNINIETVDISTDNYEERIITMLAGGETVDIISLLNMPFYVNLAERGQLLDLSDFVNTIDREPFGETLNFMRVGDNSYFGIPYRWHIWALFYNKDLFDAAGLPYPEHLTWDEYRELAMQLTSGEGADKIYGAHLHTWRSITNGIAAAQMQRSQLTDDFSFFVDQYELVLGMQAEGSAMDFGTIFSAGVGYRPRFELENAAMMPMGTWYLQELAERAEFNWGVAPLPQISRDSEIATMGMPTAFGINSNTAQGEAALKFIEFATGEEGARLIAGIGNVPAFMTDEILDIYFSVDGMPQDELTRRALNPDRVELEMQLSPQTAEIDQILNEIHELIMVGEINLEDGIRQMNERVGPVLQRQ